MGKTSFQVKIHGGKVDMLTFRNVIPVIGNSIEHLESIVNTTDHVIQSGNHTED